MAVRGYRSRFIDRVRFLAVGGEGSIGCASFFRDTRVESGPPDGGSGGRGGDVLLSTCKRIHDLKMPSYNVKGGNGTNGSSDHQNGRTGTHRVVKVPCGTSVYQLGDPSYTRTSYMEPESTEPLLIADLVIHGDEHIVARGGPPGRGNAALRAGRLQAARMSEHGGAGEAVTLMLSLKLVGDVGLVGFPNAGKSSVHTAYTHVMNTQRVPSLFSLPCTPTQTTVASYIFRHFP